MAEALNTNPDSDLENVDGEFNEVDEMIMTMQMILLLKD